MSLFKKIKSAIQKFFGGGSSTKTSRASRVSNYGGGGSRSYRDYSSGGYKSDYQDRQDEEKRRRQEQARRQKATTDALASISKRTDALSSGKSPTTASPATSTGNGLARTLKKIEQKATPPDVKLKQDAKEASKDRATKLLKAISEGTQVKTPEALVKSGDYEYRPKANNMNTPSADSRSTTRLTLQGYKKRMSNDAYRTAESLARGLSGDATFGAVDVLMHGNKNDKTEQEIEKYYQEHKSKKAENIGRLAGSLMGFGMSGSAATSLAKEVAPNFVKKGGRFAVEQLVKSPAFRKAAAKEAEKAGLKLTDDVIERFALQRATRIVNAVGSDMAINWTTGGLMDVNYAIRDTYDENDGNFNGRDFVKNLAKNRAINYGVGGLVTVAPALRTQKGLLREGLLGSNVLKKSARDDAAELARTITNENGMRQAMSDAFGRNADNARFDMNDLLERNLKKSTDAFSTPKIGDAAKAELPKMRQAMREAFVNEGDDAARRIDMNEILANNSPFRQANQTARQLDPERGIQLIENDEGLLDQYRARFEQNLNDLDINSMEEILERIRQTARESGIDYDTSEIERTIAGYRRIIEDMENGIEWRRGNRGWERLTKKGNWRKTDPFKPKPEPKAKAAKPAEQALTPEAREAMLEDAEIKARNIANEIADKERPKNPRLTREERAANIENLNTGEANAADDIGRFAGINEDVNYKGERVDMGFEQGGDELAKAKNAVREEVENTRASASEFDKERAEAAAKAGLDVKPEAKERMTVGEINEVRGNEVRSNYHHTEKGFGTAATGLGDVEFKGKAYDAIARGELNIDVYHNKENYEAAAKRLKEHLDRNGNMDAWRDKFNDYAKRVLPLNTEEQRQLIYDGLAAIDYANSMAKSEIKSVRDDAGDLFISACKALSEQASVGGLTGNQFRMIAMSSPEYRAQAMYETILGIFNRSKGMRKTLNKGKGNPITPEELRDIINNNPALKKTLDALNKLDSASSVEEVEKLASKAYLEARRVIPMTAFDQLTQWRYVAMLSSPKTHIRNLTSNIYSATLGQGRDAIASSIETKIFKGKGKYGQQLQKQIEVGKIKEEDLMKSAGGFSLSANRDSRKGTKELFKVNSLTTKLEHAKEQLADVKISDSAEMKRLNDRVKNLESELDKAQKALDETVGSIKRKEAKKAQEFWQTRGRDSLVADAEKWERRQYNGNVSKGIFKLNDKASNFIGKALETSDAISLEGIYREKMDKILTTNGWSELVEKAGKGDLAAKARLEKLEEYASQEAAYTAARDTYRNYSKLSSALNKFVSDSLFNYDAPLWKKGLGLLTHSLVPFTKVPVNLVKRGLNYSPIGLIEAKYSLEKAIAAGDVVEINRACERIAEGRIGTGIAALGAGLGFADPNGMLITGRLNKNDFIDKKKKDAGYQNYSFNANNMSFTLDWASPTAATLFTGVEFGRMVRDAVDSIAEGNGVNFDFWKAFDVPLVLVSSLIEPTLQLGVFQGINDALTQVVEADNYSDTDIHPALQLVGNIMTNYGTSMISPAILGSLTRSFSPYDYYTPYGNTSAESTFNQQLAKHPLAAKLTGNELGANTNVWGQIKGEKKTTGDYAKAFALNNLSPANVKKITWDKTDQWAADYYKKTGFEGVFPQNYRKDNFNVGRIKDEHVIEMNAKDIADYNVARGKSGADAMDALLNDTVLFTRYSKDEKGSYTIADPNNLSDEEKEKLIKDAENWSLKEVVDWMRTRPEFKNASQKEQQTALGRVYGQGNSPFTGDDDQVYGSTRGAQRAIAMKNGMSADEYDYYNEVPARVQENLKAALDAGVITVAQALDYARSGGKTYYRTDESGETGGSVTTYYNKAEGIAYLEEMGYSHDEAEALYNAFKKSNAKDYDYAASHSGKRGYRRRRYRRRGYRRYSGGGSSAKATVPKPKVLKSSQFVKGEALGSTSKSKSSTSSVKITPPELKRVKAKVDLPTARRKEY